MQRNIQRTLAHVYTLLKRGGSEIEDNCIFMHVAIFN